MQGTHFFKFHRLCIFPLLQLLSSKFTFLPTNVRSDQKAEEAWACLASSIRISSPLTPLYSTNSVQDWLSSARGLPVPWCGSRRAWSFCCFWFLVVALASRSPPTCSTSYLLRTRYDRRFEGSNISQSPAKTGLRTASSRGSYPEA